MKDWIILFGIPYQKHIKIFLSIITTLNSTILSIVLLEVLLKVMTSHVK